MNVIEIENINYIIYLLVFSFNICIKEYLK